MALKVQVLLSMLLLYCLTSAEQGDSSRHMDGHEMHHMHHHMHRPLIGRPDGHERGVPDGRKDERLLGRPDGHERGVPDEHDHQQQSKDDGLLGRPDGHERGVPDGRKDDRLIRCKRPMCEMYCADGFETDSSGCPICRCRSPHSTQALIGRPDGHELASCKNRPICRMYCANGFQTDEFGCLVCRCLANPCLGNPCSVGLSCVAEPCEQRASCVKLEAKCIESHKSPVMCPEPMCANFCPHGYQKNADGCMTCVCKPALCGERLCEEDQICRLRTVNGVKTSVCSVRTLCEAQRLKPVGLGGVAPECESDGTFRPIQCNAALAVCWCVDGLGKEIAGTRTTSYVEQQKPKCVHNITVSTNIHMILVVQRDINIQHNLNSLKPTIVEHVSSWLLIERDYISLVKTEAKNSDNDAKSTFLEVELVVIHDGVSDLPSATDYMKRHMLQGRCHMSHGLRPMPDSLQIKHQFKYSTEKPAHHHWDHLHMTKIIPAVIITIIVLITIVAVASRRRRYGAANFRHQKLESVASINASQKFDNLLENATLASVEKKGEKEKEPVA